MKSFSFGVERDMSNQAGRGGMGSHKHGTSGRGGPSPRAKQNAARDNNAELALLAAQRAKRRAVDSYESISDALKKFKPK